MTDFILWVVEFIAFGIFMYYFAEVLNWWDSRK